MNQTQRFNQTISSKFPFKKFASIHKYLQQINFIKNDSQLRFIPSHTRYHSHSNMISTLQNMNQTNYKQHIFQRSNDKCLQKKRCISMKQQIQPFNSIRNKTVNTHTFYNSKNNSAKISKQACQTQASKSKLGKKEISLKQVHKYNFAKTNYQSSNKRVMTEPNDTFFIDHQQKIQLGSPFSHNQLNLQSIQDRKQKNKHIILEKIQLYIRQLDKKGEDELVDMLTNNYRKRIRFHIDAYLYEQKIKQMIDVNKQMVAMLKQEFLTKKDFMNAENKNVQNPIKNLFRSELNTYNKIIIDESEDNIDKTLKQKTQAKQNIIQNQERITNQNLQTNQVLKEQIQHKVMNDTDYQNQIYNATKQFTVQWSKSQNHKKTVYQKFRKSIFQKYPQFKERQIIQKGQDKNKKLQRKNSIQNLDFVFQHPSIKNNQQLSKRKINSIESQRKQKQKVSQDLNKSKQSEKNKQKQTHVELSISNSHIRQLRQSFSKISRLSKKNSVSKGSTKTFDLLSSQNKQQVAKINFQNLIEFIFKRAFFYSISKKKVIQNKAPSGQMRYSPRVQKKDPHISFIRYNGSSQQKRYLRVDKLNQKKIKTSGNYLIKNKYKIMDLQKQGNKQFDFLRKCLDDAIQDYLKKSKKK